MLLGLGWELLARPKLATCAPAEWLARSRSRPAGGRHPRSRGRNRCELGQLGRRHVDCRRSDGQGGISSYGGNEGQGARPPGRR